MSRKTSCGIAELFPIRFEYVLGLFVALKKQLEDEEKERKKQESEANGGKDINVSNYTQQANSMMSNARVPNVQSMAGGHMPSMPSMPSVPHL